MKRVFTGLVGVAAFSMWLVETSVVAAQNKKAHNASAQEYNILNSVKDVRGTVAQISATSNTLTITVDTSHTEAAKGGNPAIRPNIGGAQAEARDMARVRQDMARLQQEVAKLQKEELQLAQAKNVKDAASKRAKVQQEINRVQQDYVRLQKDLARLQAQEIRNDIQDQRAFQAALAKNTKVVKESLNFELAIEDKAVIRKMFVPANLTDKEKQELKGKNTSLPGYTATIADIAVGQEVHIYLTPDKSSAKDKPDGSRPTINKIIILTEGGNSAPDPKKKANN